MSNIQKWSAFLAVIFIATYLYQTLHTTDSSMTLVALFVFCWSMAYLNPKKMGEFKAKILGQEVRFKTATEADQLTALGHNLDAERDVSLPRESIEEILERIESKSPLEKTDADYLELATLAWKGKKLHEAMHYAFTGLGRPPSNSKITAALYSRLGAINANLDFFGAAEKYYKEAIKIDPQYSIAYNNIGTLYAMTNRFDDAEENLKKAIELEPEFGAANNNLGNLYSYTDRLDEAETSYKKAIALDAQYASPPNNLGALYFDTGRFDEAEASYKKAIELNPKYTAAHFNLGNLYQNTNRPDEAEACFKKVVELDPKHAKAINNLKDVQTLIAEKE